MNICMILVANTNSEEVLYEHTRCVVPWKRSPTKISLSNLFQIYQHVKGNLQ